MKDSCSWRPAFIGVVCLVLMGSGAFFVTAHAARDARAASPKGGLGSTPWPMFGHDALHTGRSPYAGSQNANLKWQYAIEGAGGIASSPAIGLDGALFFGADDGAVYAVRPGDGALRWKYSTGGAVKSSPAVGWDGTVYVGSNDKYLYALDPASGTLKWKKLLGAAVESSPAMGDDGTLYVGTWSGLLYALDTHNKGAVKWKKSVSDWVASSPAMGQNGNLYVVTATGLLAMKPSDGTILWRYPHGGASSPGIADDGTLFYGSDSEGIVAVNPDGTKKWHHNVTGAGTSSPAIGSDGMVYVGTGYPDYRFYALHPTDGSIKWSNMAYSHAEHPALGIDGTIYFTPEGLLMAVNPQDGSTRWVFQCPMVGGEYDWGEGSAIIGQDGTLYFGTRKGRLYAVGSMGLGATPWPMFRHDPAHTGKSPYRGSHTANVKWKFDSEGSVQSSPALALDGTVYVGSDQLYALRSDSGEVLWSYPTGTITTSSPAVGADGTIYVGTGSTNQFYAVLPDGTLKWSFSAGGKIESSPAIAENGTLYIGSSDGNLYALDSNGSLKWAYATGGAIVSSPTLGGSDRAIYVGSFDGNLYAISPNGTLKWKTSNYAGQISSSPAVGPDGTIYVGTPYLGLQAFNPDKTEKWAFKPGTEAFNSSPAIGADGTIYIGCNDSKLYAVNADGSMKWSYPTGGWLTSSVAIGADGILYVGSDDHKIYAFNPDGTLMWSLETGGPVVSSPAIGPDGTVYVGSNDYNLYAVKTSPIMVSPTKKDFGALVMGQSSSPLKVIVSNAGQADLIISSTVLTDHGGFTLDPNGGTNPCGSLTPTLGAGQSCSMTVTFAPTKWSVYWTQLKYIAADPDVADGVVTLVGEGIPSQVVTLTLNLPAALSADPPVKAYRMIGIPLQTQNGDLFSTLAGSFGGKADPAVWRLYAYGASGYREIVYPDQESVAYGKGWWIISRDSKAIPVEGVPQETDFSMTLAAGYRMIASPYYDTPLAWSNVLADPSNTPLQLGSDLYGWAETGNYEKSATLDPSKSYWAWCTVGGTLYLSKSQGTAARLVPLDTAATTEVRQPPPPLPPGALLTLVTPNGGQSWRYGETRTVRWVSAGIKPEGFRSTIQLLVSYDGGKNYRLLASNLPAKGAFRWTIPPRGAASSQCLIKVKSSLYPQVEGVSERVFRIGPSRR